ncbi:MAG TPA: hypothetical protein VNN20_01845 [Thermodesulfobacteriota bacterium]|nr:hypothetical protein [Thermodesulfobacteriota bacterium]
MKMIGVAGLLSIAVAIITLFIFSPVSFAQQNSPDANIKIVRLDPRFDKIVPQDAVIEEIADGFTWVEGPVWNREGG